MAIIGRVEKKSWKIRLLNLTIHIVLILGAATMVYPLMLMLSGSVKSSVDFKDFSIWPEYLASDSEGKELLFRKYLATKYNNSTLRMSGSFKMPSATFDTVVPPKRPNSTRQAEEYAEFLAECRRELPHYWFCIGMAAEPGVDTLSVRRFRTFLREQMKRSGYSGEAALKRINERFGTQYAEWEEISLPSEDFFQRRSVTDYSSGIQRALLAFKYSPYVDELTEIWPDAEGEMIALIRRDVSRDLSEVNGRLGTDYSSWAEVTVPATVYDILPTTADGNNLAAELWEEFVKNEINPDFIRIDPRQANAPWRLFLADKYKQDIAALNRMHGTQYKSFEEPVISSGVPRSGAVRTDWMDFVKMNTTEKKLWPEFLREICAGDIAKLNAKYKSAYAKFSEVPLAGPDAGMPGPREEDLRNMRARLAEIRKRELPAGAITFDSLAIRYRAWLKKRYGGSISAMNNAYSNGYNTFSEISLPDSPCGEDNLAADRDWRDFVRTLPPERVGLGRAATSEYRKFIRSLYLKKDGSCDYEKLSADYGMSIRDDSHIPFFRKDPAQLKRRAAPKAREDYIRAVRSGKFDAELRLDAPGELREQWQDFLKRKYLVISGLNAAWHLTPRSFDEVPLPVRDYEWHLVGKHTAELQHEYLFRNYIMVFETLFTNGGAALNTLIYCLLSVLASLLVNPLCAYGLSRFKPASTYKILLFLMLPMAFPGMVLGIPQFLLIKNLGLLNTFAALILPAMANGYSIFLLKGFFDSLPKELFESAALDGAGEWTVFRNIAMRLSTPILSVIALSSFTAAYGNFMMAFLLCQNKSMWTMMVYLYQLQQRASPAVGFAALVIAAIPTLLVFIFCQNIIIKGIVVPSEK